MTDTTRAAGLGESAPEDQSEAYRETIEARVAKAVARFRKDAAGLVPRDCPLCGYHGRFTAFGRPPRLDAQCARCGALERHRLFALMIARDPESFGPADSVLHFAPEPVLKKRIRPRVASYETADRRDMRRLTHRIDIEDIDLPGALYTRIVCNHVLEHVDDAKALAELFRLLRPGGRVYLTVPIVEGWDATYENPDVTEEADRVLHFGQKDHLRYYGRDLRDRIRAAGFDLREITAEEPDVHRHGLLRGEKIFVGVKPGAEGTK